MLMKDKKETQLVHNVKSGSYAPKPTAKVTTGFAAGDLTQEGTYPGANPARKAGKESNLLPENITAGDGSMSGGNSTKDYMMVKNLTKGNKPKMKGSPSQKEANKPTGQKGY